MIYRDIKLMYEVSNKGRIRNFRSGKFLTPVKNISNDHYQVSLRLNESSNKWNGKRSFAFHILIAVTFISNPENKPIVHHKDGNPGNNCVDNLMWVTESEHQHLTYELEQRDRKTGSKNINVKYKPEQYEHLIKLIQHNPDISIKELSNLTGISVNMVRVFVNGDIKWDEVRNKNGDFKYNGLNSNDESVMRDVFRLAENEDISIAEISRLTGVNTSTISSIVNHYTPSKWQYLYKEFNVPNRNNRVVKDIFDDKTKFQIRKLVNDGYTPKEVISILKLDTGINSYSKLYRFILKCT